VRPSSGKPIPGLGETTLRRYNRAIKSTPSNQLKNSNVNISAFPAVALDSWGKADFQAPKQHKSR
jgi:hypothetical protein